MSRIEEATRARFGRRARNRKGRKRPFVATDLGRKVLGQIIPPLAAYIASDDAPSPPQGLETVVRQVQPDELALIALAALLNKIDTGWNRQDESARLKICLAIGNDLRDQLEVRRLLEQCPAAHTYVMHAKSRQGAIWRFRRLDWSQADLARAGGWLLDCTEALDFFTLDGAGFPMIAPDHQEAVDRLREELIYAYPYYLPLLAPPPNWKGWRSHYEDRISATFVRDSHPDTVKEVTAAFANGSMKQHVNGVNAIQRVPFVINERMLPVVRAFALDLAKAKAGGGFFDEEMTSNLIKRDVGTAEFLAKRGKFWTPCNIDTRGRVYGLPYFNFQREDHVRSLFLFAEGEPIGDDTHWLEVAVTNHFGVKGTWGERLAWAAKERELIRSVAADPVGTFDYWRAASDPLSFVAACMELAAAAKNRSCVTRFPVLLDGSCNGIQHLALMTRDEEAGRLVNLTDDTIQDLYLTVEGKVRERLETSVDAEAKWWLGRGRLSRALIKQPVMTFAYGVTESGAKDQIIDEYKRLHGWEDGLSNMARYLARLIRHVSDDLLPRPAAAMKYICKLVDHCTKRGEPLRWISPTGLPIANRYYESNTSTVEMKLRGVRVRYRVADGWSSDIVKHKARNSAPANFVHSRDAAHLIRSVNAAVSEGLTNIVCVHDCFGTVAPRSGRFQQILRRELSLMHVGRLIHDPSRPPSLGHNPLAQLRVQNAGEDYPPAPPQGTLDPTSVATAEYTFR